jgi:hypothetical protein
MHQRVSGIDVLLEGQLPLHVPAVVALTPSIKPAAMVPAETTDTMARRTTIRNCIVSKYSSRVKDSKLQKLLSNPNGRRRQGAVLCCVRAFSAA